MKNSQACFKITSWIECHKIGDWESTWKRFNHTGDCVAEVSLDHYNFWEYKVKSTSGSSWATGWDGAVEYAKKHADDSLRSYGYDLENTISDKLLSMI